MADRLTIDLDSRFHRQQLITWWDQNRLRNARILVVGAGALGNEILKNLALLGVGRILVIDLDTIENSNLSRAVLFRDRDLGQSKAHAAAAAAKDLYPDLAIRPLHGNVIYDLGLGVFKWADIVICGLDNREARLEVNRACYRVGTPWIDGAIEGLDGQMRVFHPPDGPCYECLMSEVDWQIMSQRRSCAMLTREDLQQAKTPTTATMASLIAALQTQEAVKWIHGMHDSAGTGLVFQGLSNETIRIKFELKSGCMSHNPMGEITPLGCGVQDMTARSLLQWVADRVGDNPIIDLNRDLLTHLECPICKTREEHLMPLGLVKEDRARCPNCNQIRIPHSINQLDPASDLLDRSLAELGAAPMDILTIRGDNGESYAYFDGDEKAVLGELL